jgi:hypothetical protein
MYGKEKKPREKDGMLKNKERDILKDEVIWKVKSVKMKG